MHVRIKKSTGLESRFLKNPMCNRKGPCRTGNESATPSSEYVGPGDFCRVFETAMPNLHLLALLLTAKADKAEQCFVAGLEDCLQGNPIFKEWSLSWAKRAIIKRAIAVISPAIGREQPVIREADQMGKSDARLSAVMELAPFERFVFVMSVLEGYSDQECCVLLDCTRRDIAEARVQAVQQVAEPEQKSIDLRA